MKFFSIKEIDERIKNLTKDFLPITTFNQMFDSIENINQKQSLNEMKECLRGIEKAHDNAHEIQRESFQVNTKGDLIFSIFFRCLFITRKKSVKISKFWKINSIKSYFQLWQRIILHTVEEKYPHLRSFLIYLL